MEDMSLERVHTDYMLRELAFDIESYRKEFGHFPSTLNDLTNIMEGSAWPEFSDSWKHPLVYSVDGTNYLIKSFGRDGKPGGQGLDCDLTTRDLHPPESALPLRQFLFDVRIGPMLGTCAVSGFITFILTIILVKRPDFSRSGLKSLGLRLGAVVIGAALVAGLMAALHVPVHHH
jgi:hypothetical protein